MKYFITIFLMVFTVGLLSAQENGTVKWTFSTGDNIYCIPAIAEDGTIYLPSYDKYLYALNSDGALKWKFHALEDHDWECFLGTPPAVASDGTIFFADNSFGIIFALNPDGTEKWRRDMTEGVIKAPPSIAPDGSIILVTSMRDVFSLNPDDGTTNWHYTFSGGEDESGAVIDAEGTIFVRGGYLKSITSSGTLSWKFENGSSVYSSAVIGQNGIIYVAGDDNKLYAVKADGSEEWNFTTGDDINGSPVIGADGTIYVFSMDGYLYAVNPDGTQKWKFSEQFQAMFGNYTASPVVGADGLIYFAGIMNDYSTKLFAINPDGTENWSSPLSDIVRFPATISKDSLLLVPQGSDLLAIKVGSAGLADSPFPKYRGGYTNTGYADVVATAIAQIDNNVPQEFSLSDAYPNPFNPTTNFRFSVPKNSQVNISVYNALGQLVDNLVNDTKSSGTYEVTWNASSFGSGIYFVRINAGSGFTQTKKVILMK
jgi:outer membrane protein assembly factor BamB